ncbi:MAG: histidine phosphatase family protein [Acidobacteria bacterium]|nr:histidine phosphatase family protein [Acidobacteriota bacterium]
MSGEHPRAAVLLVHHADAVGPEVDPQRPLSAAGRAQAAWLADYAKRAGLVPDVIWHSGKLRARETAEALLFACNPRAVLRAVRGLRPEDSPEWVRAMLAGETQMVALVSHMPLMPALLRRLVRADTDFPPHGMVLLDRGDEGSYVERWRIAPPAT